ncbi:MAG TPA: EamA family transporter [Nevskiaceae bacterium]|nr:EamA family transporter [Nevskiaceae bacterium]
MEAVAVSASERRSKVIGAFAVLYLVWGSTYLAIRIVVEHLPPALSAGVRFVFAGLLMLGYAWWQGHRIPRSRRDWVTIATTGTLLLVGANGLVMWSEQWVDSNQAALIVATSALWTAWLGTLGASGERLSRLTLVGLLLGFGGVAVLVSDGLHLGHAPGYAYAALMLSPILWSLGAILSKRRPAACAPIMTAALQTLFAAVVMTTLGLAGGEAAQWTWAPRSLLALAYLVVFGSFVAYGCFLWLVHEVPPAQLGTYAYVNPAVAVLLGWWILDERLAGLQVAGTAIILIGVLITTVASTRRR